MTNMQSNSNCNNLKSNKSLLALSLIRARKIYTLFSTIFYNKKIYKIVEILNLSNIPGETLFSVQISHKNCIAHLSAAKIIEDNYNLDNFSKFHAQLIREAAKGNLIDFLNSSEKEPAYKILSKRYCKKTSQYIFTIQDQNHICFERSAYELSLDKNLIENISMQDIYDIAYTHGAQSILNEKASLMLAKKQ